MEQSGSAWKEEDLEEKEFQGGLERVSKQYGLSGKKGLEKENLARSLLIGWDQFLVWLAFSLFFVCRKTHLVLT